MCFYDIPCVPYHHWTATRKLKCTSQDLTCEIQKFILENGLNDPCLLQLCLQMKVKGTQLSLNVQQKNLVVRCCKQLRVHLLATVGGAAASIHVGSEGGSHVGSGGS